MLDQAGLAGRLRRMTRGTVVAVASTTDPRDRFSAVNDVPDWLPEIVAQAGVGPAAVSLAAA